MCGLLISLARVLLDSAAQLRDPRVKIALLFGRCRFEAFELGGGVTKAGVGRLERGERFEVAIFDGREVPFELVDVGLEIRELLWVADRAAVELRLEWRDLGPQFIGF